MGSGSALIFQLQLLVIYVLMLLKHTKLPCCIDFVHECVYIIQDARLERVKSHVVLTAVVPCLTLFSSIIPTWPGDGSRVIGHGVAIY
jgi:hypothetical protein